MQRRAIGCGFIGGVCLIVAAAAVHAQEIVRASGANEPVVIKQDDRAWAKEKPQSFISFRWRTTQTKAVHKSSVQREFLYAVIPGVGHIDINIIYSNSPRLIEHSRFCTKISPARLELA